MIAASEELIERRPARLARAKQVIAEQA